MSQVLVGDHGCGPGVTDYFLQKLTALVFDSWGRQAGLLLDEVTLGFLAYYDGLLHFLKFRVLHFVNFAGFFVINHLIKAHDRVRGAGLGYRLLGQNWVLGPGTQVVSIRSVKLD